MRLTLRMIFSCRFLLADITTLSQVAPVNHPVGI